MAMAGLPFEALAMARVLQRLRLHGDIENFRPVTVRRYNWNRLKDFISHNTRYFSYANEVPEPDICSVDSPLSNLIFRVPDWTSYDWYAERASFLDSEAVLWTSPVLDAEHLANEQAIYNRKFRRFLAATMNAYALESGHARTNIRNLTPQILEAIGGSRANISSAARSLLQGPSE
jgi:hypothetical protein